MKKNSKNLEGNLFVKYSEGNGIIDYSSEKGFESGYYPCEKVFWSDLDTSKGDGRLYVLEGNVWVSGLVQKHSIMTVVKAYTPEFKESVRYRKVLRSDILYLGKVPKSQKEVLIQMITGQDQESKKYAEEIIKNINKTKRDKL